jgi:glycosyltransferase involved in cell wall biosynthesis
MQILVLTPVYPHSSNPAEGLFNEQHALALTRAGIQVTVVVCKPWLPNGLAKVWKRYNSLADLPQMEERNGIPIVYALYFHIPQYQLPHVTVSSCARSILQAIDRLNLSKTFDLIQVHSSWPVGLASPAVARALSRPFVITLHIQDEPRLYDSKGGSTLYSGMIKGASAVVVVGSTLERFAKDRGMGSDRSRLRIIPNGVDLATVKEVLREACGGQNGWGNIISVANLWPIKGIDLNLKALAHLGKVGIRWHTYTIVGDGPERARLEELAKNLGIVNRVRFTGRLSHRETLREVAEADIFSLPSWQEAFGVVYLEAMACGKPVIGCRGQGAEDIVRHEKDGLLVDPRDIGSLGRAMQRLLIEREFAQELGRSAMNRAQVFTWQQNVRQYVEVYEEVIARTQIPSQSNRPAAPTFQKIY